MPTLIVDMDGTLIECSRYYIETNQRAATYLERVTGLPADQVAKVLEAIDLAAVTLKDGFNRERYPRSFEAAALALCHVVAEQRPDVVPYWNHVQVMREIGESVFDAPYEEYPGARETLAQYKAAGWRLVLYTKGDREVQGQKIARHGYGELFDVCGITRKKDADTLRSFCAECQIDPEDAWMVGDSLKDDIAPANALGIRSVHVIKEAHAWSYDHAEVQPTATIEAVSQLLTVIPLASESATGEAA